MGLPEYPRPLEKAVMEILRRWDIEEVQAQDIPPEWEGILDQWIEARAEPIRAMKMKHGGNQVAIFRELGWEKRKDKKRKARKNAAPTVNDQVSSVGPLETRATKRKWVQSPLPGLWE